MTETAPHFLAQYALETVPRYTSYPPATSFHEGIGLADWSAWMRQQPRGSDVSLYIHIPFCKSMCWYCGCHTTIPNRHGRVARYLDALDIDITRRAELTPAGSRVTHIHFGGGSPDTLQPAEFARIMARVRECFTVETSAEIAIELDPRGVTPDLCETLAEHGVTRASLGVQDLSGEVQLLINRVQPRGLVERAAAMLRAAGIGAINMDMMYGLPAQSEARVISTATALAEMGADRVSVFGYAHVPWFKKHQRAIPDTRLPGASERFDQMLAAAATLDVAGYDAIGFDHFARPEDPLAIAARDGTLRRNFQGYTTDRCDILIGLGASAISETPQGYVQTIADPVRYAEALTSGEDMLARGVARSPTEYATYSRLADLLCRFETELTPADGVHALHPIITDGLARIEAGRLAVTARGKPYVRNIAARLDPAFELAENRHSTAV